jgi:hypothetical protein
MPQTEALKPEDLGKTASQPTAAKPAKVEAAAGGQARDQKAGGSQTGGKSRRQAQVQAEAAKAEPAKALACYDWGTLDAKLLTRVKGGLPGLKLKAEQWWKAARARSRAMASSGYITRRWPPSLKPRPCLPS